MILVTGATGFIGRYLVEGLLKKNYKIAVLANKAPAVDKWAEDSRIRIFRVDITKPRGFLTLPRRLKIEAVFHLAAHIPKLDSAQDFRDCVRVNLGGAYNLLEYAKVKKVRKIINTSTVCVYYTDKFYLMRLKENSRVCPLNYYGITKLAAESLFEKYKIEHRAKVVSLRCSVVYGVGQDRTKVLPLFIQRAINNQNLEIFGEGIKIEDYVYVKDVVDANILALTGNADGIYNIGSGKGTNVVDLAKAIIQIFDSKSKIRFNRPKKEDAKQIIMDISKAKREIGYQPTYDLRRGLEEYRQILEREI